MVYKKYIKRGEKIYGPYKYHSHKVNGKVTTEYLGKELKKDKNKLSLIFVIIGLITLCALIFILNYTSITGFTTSEEKPKDNLAIIRTVIEITSAEHLDSSRQFISDIYNQVKALDDIWSETINNNEYVRVVFEQELDSSKDITVFPRIIDGNPKIEIYEVSPRDDSGEPDGTKIIAEFTNINSNDYNKVFLTNLQGTQNTFDLKVLDGSLEFDYIYDPSTSSPKEVKK